MSRLWKPIQYLLPVNREAPISGSAFKNRIWSTLGWHASISKSQVNLRVLSISMLGFNTSGVRINSCQTLYSHGILHVQNTRKHTSVEHLAGFVSSMLLPFSALHLSCFIIEMTLPWVVGITHKSADILNWFSLIYRRTPDYILQFCLQSVSSFQTCSRYLAQEMRPRSCIVSRHTVFSGFLLSQHRDWFRFIHD